MNTFDQAIADLHAQQEGPLREAKTKLASTRAELEDGLKHLEKTIARTQGVFDRAMARYNKAAGLGIIEPNLQQHLFEAVGGPNGQLGIIPGGVMAYQHDIAQIDHFSEADLRQGLDRWLMNAPARLRASAGRLVWLAETIETTDVPALEALVERVRQEKQARPVMTRRDQGSGPSHATVRVESDFDPREL